MPEAGFYSRADQEFYGRGQGPELKNWQSAVRDGLCSAGLDPYNGLTLDHSVGTSASTFESSGRRHS
ncbi:Glucose-methanol-choline oxidoreductase family protein isoform 1 [Cucumis melo var. makuwa]|uniref:Glucose-methanol-choline oxidoreductase family protein isoform 1 n=1 Tax=Cucumis melo var. makuwa TaxID=1194695 RepID=A0A5D3BYV1_CUCMM|nr:Glucose-methanol-choline oxidoreductase family protein isoform 1 [Cucumis melo var. makuwa]